MKDELQTQFQSDLKLMNMFRVFTGLAVLLGALGLFGLSSFVVSQRIKEMGVRRVLGASGFNLMEIISGTFHWPLVIGTLMAMVALFLGSREWLATFPFRTQLHWSIFGIPVLVVLLLAAAIALYQTGRLLARNPVQSLRSE